MKTELVKLIKDYANHVVPTEYSIADQKEAIRQGIIEINGSDKLTPRSFRNPEMFELVETLIKVVVNDGLKGDEAFMSLVEERNIAEGDSSEFVVEHPGTLIVADVSRGNTGIRRQRIDHYTEINIRPVPHAIKVYAELTHVLSGKIDIIEFGARVADAMRKARLNDVFVAFNGIAQADLGATYYPNAGSYDEEALLAVCQHVSAANDGAPVMIMGTLAAVRKITTGIMSNDARSDFYNFGYMLKWNGITTLAMAQRHQVGTDNFLLNDNKLYIFPVTHDDKPIKQVIGGEDYLSITNTGDNADLSQEVTLISQWNTGVIIGKKFGIYEMA